MFGYLRPVEGEMKVSELEHFKACYCGLCHALGRKYGIVARFSLNYELVFLAMLLWEPNDEPVFMRKRCFASICRKKNYCVKNGALDICAGYTVILTWWKLKDTIADEDFIKSIPHRLLMLVFSGAYRKAAREFPCFDRKVREEIASLAENESRGELSLDGAADKFAQILSATVPDAANDAVRRPMLELLYHLGRWIYIIDAYDDYVDDVKKGNYNPITAHYPPVEGRMPESGTRLLESTLIHSNNLLCLAYELLPENAWTQIMGNMLYLGMPDVLQRVLEGKWPPQPPRYNKEWN